MSASNRGKVRYPIIGTWSANVGYLLAHQVQDGGGVWVRCAKCATWEPVNLPRLVIERTPLFSLWNRRPPCPACGCKLTFHGHHASGARVIPFTTDNPAQTNDLHAAWDRERRRLRGEVT
jgi:hypothetical protein